MLLSLQCSLQPGSGRLAPLRCLLAGRGRLGSLAGRLAQAFQGGQRSSWQLRRLRCSKALGVGGRTGAVGLAWAGILAQGSWGEAEASKPLLHTCCRIAPAPVACRDWVASSISLSNPLATSAAASCGESPAWCSAKWQLRMAIPGA